MDGITATQSAQTMEPWDATQQFPPPHPPMAEPRSVLELARMGSQAAVRLGAWSSHGGDITPQDTAHY